MAGGNKFNHKQEAALAALLGSATVQQAASKARVGLRTLRRWLGEEDFAAAYVAARKQVLTGVIGDLVAASTEAVATLQANLTAERPGDRIRAAVAILDHATKGVEGDLAGQVEELSRILAELKEGTGDGRIPSHAQTPPETPRPVGAKPREEP